MERFVDDDLRASMREITDWISDDFRRNALYTEDVDKVRVGVCAFLVAVPCRIRFVWGRRRTMNSRDVGVQLLARNAGAIDAIMRTAAARKVRALCGASLACALCGASLAFGKGPYAILVDPRRHEALRRGALP